jgi:hypothetical protein
MQSAQNQELAQRMGQRLSLWASAWPYVLHMTSYRGRAHSLRGIHCVFLIKSGFLTIQC